MYEMTPRWYYLIGDMDDAKEMCAWLRENCRWDAYETLLPGQGKIRIHIKGDEAATQFKLTFNVVNANQ